MAIDINIEEKMKKEAEKQIEKGGSLSVKIIQNECTVFTLELKGYEISVIAHAPSEKVKSVVKTTGTVKERIASFEALAKCLTVGISYSVRF